MSYCGLSGVCISDELLRMACIGMIVKYLSSQQTLNKWFFSTKSLGKRERCCKSLGYHPLWFNSETYKLSEEEYREIMKYVEVLYNIPDIDETGISKGTELALRYIDIHTIWLPQWLRTYHDNRGKGRKDLRDWMDE